MIVKLPNGFLDGADHFNIIELDELRGKQQNYLADESLVVGNIGHIPRILSDMILSVRTEEGLKWQGDKNKVPWLLRSGDLEFLLIKIRENTYGPKYYFELECERCNHVEKNIRLDLDKLEVFPVPKEKLTELFTIELPKSKEIVEFKPVYLEDMFTSLKIAKKNKDSLVTSFLSLVIKRIGDNENVSSEDLEKLAVKDIQFLGEQTQGLIMEGTIDTEVEMTCSNCNHEYKSKINCYDPSFFDPSRGSAS